MTSFVIAACAVLGLAVGSFLNVVIWRVPRKESVVRPRSRCPSCAAPIAPRDNVPVLSWLLLRGHCRRCGERISVRYPLVETGTAALFAAVGARFAESWALPAYLLLAAALLAIAVIDLEHYIIPNRIVYPVGIASVPLLALASALEGDWGAFGRSLLGGFGAFGALFVIHVIAPSGMGFGDVRLSALLGLYLGWLGGAEVAAGIFLGFLYGALVGIALIVAGVRKRRQHIPFGPFLAAGALTMVLAGPAILGWYRGLGTH